MTSLFGFGLAACQAPISKKYPYLIKVRIEGCQWSTGRLFRPGTQDAGLLNSARWEQGQLVFKGVVAHPGVYHVSCLCQNSKNFTNAEVYLPADSVQLAILPGANLRPAIYQTLAVPSYLKNSQLYSTAQQQREVASYLLTRDSLRNKYFLNKNRLKAKMDEAIATGNKPEIDRWADSTRRAQAQGAAYGAAASELYIRRHPQSEVGLFALLDASDDAATAKRLAPYYQAMPAAWQTSFFGKAVAERFHLAAAPAEAH
ncbi:MAG: hypothetical protein ACRYFZ_17260 [Janthinobacterium lividum]